jgi:polyisoprenoid-binding protein YceI
MKLRLVLFFVLALAFTTIASAQTAPTRQVDPARSKLTVHVGKAGMFSAFGHEHDITAPVFAGTVRGQESVEFSVDARQMKVADADVSEKDRAEIQTTMLGPEVLDAARFPEIKFRSTAVDRGTNEWRVRGELMLHGQTRAIVLSVKQAGDRYTGTSTFKQTDFGIKPVSAGGGSVKVKDEVTVTFDIALK